MSGSRPQDIVRRGYDAVAARFAEWQQGVRGDERDRFVDELLARLPEDADVLELGCGAAVDSTERLAARARVTGVDISTEQIRRARERVPAATFLERDITQIEFAPASFDAVVAVFVLAHVPREQLGTLLQSVARWLRPGGHLLATMGARGLGESVDEWLGVPMYFNSISRDESLAIVRDAGLELLREEIVTMNEPEHGDVSFLWVLARRP